SPGGRVVRRTCLDPICPVPIPSGEVRAVYPAGEPISIPKSFRLTVRAGVLAVLGTGIAANADGPGPNASQCVPPAGTATPGQVTRSGVHVLIRSHHSGTRDHT